MRRVELESYEDLKKLLRVRLLDMAANREALRDAVWEPVGCGYALAAYMRLPGEDGEIGIANVPKNLPEASGIGERAVLTDALAGSASAAPPVLCPIREMLLGEGSPNLLEGEEYAGDDVILVLTAGDGCLGASALYYPGIQQQIAETVGGDYFVLPSSVHEILILPDNGELDPKELAAMVKEINQREVSPEERLGDRVLHYREDIRMLAVAAEAEPVIDRGRERD